MQKRQKQYFEQKKRQQQTARLENYADGINTCGQHHDNSRSLDILSLLNLATLAQECNSVRTIARENPDLNASPQNYHVSKNQPTRLINKVIPRDSTDLEEAETVPSVYRVETVSPNKSFSSFHDTVASAPNYPLNRNGDKLDHWKTDTEQQLSVVDLLGDDGPIGSSEGCPIHENHVAFSVEGLGEVGKETPVHSPQQPNRFFSNGCSSPPTDLRRVHSSKDLNYILDNLELEMNAVLHDINMPLGGSSMELPFNSRGIADCSGNLKSTKFSVKGCMPLDARGSPIDSFFCEEEYFYNNREEKNEKTWKNARSGFLDNNFLDERENGIGWRNLPYQIDGDSVGFLGAKNNKMPDFSSERSNSIKKRAGDKAAGRFSILESPSLYFNHTASEKDFDFINLDEARYPTVDGRLDFKGIADEPAWSYFPTEGARDSMSLISEESCSSSAVRGDKGNNSASNSTIPRQGMRRRGSEIHRAPENNYGMKNLYADETRYNWDETHQGKHLNAPGKYTRVPCPLRSKPVHFPNSTVQKNLEPQNIWLFEEGYTSIDMDSGLSSFCRTSEETEPATLSRKFWSEDPFVAFSVPKLHHIPNLSFKRSKPHAPVKCAPSGSFFSEKDVFQQPFSPVNSIDSPIFSNIRSRSRNPDISPVSEMEGVCPYSSHVAGSQGDLEFHDLSGQESDGEVGEDKSKFQPNVCSKFHKEPQKELSIGNNNLSSENGKPVDTLDSKVNCSEYNPELIERPNMKDSPEHSEEMSSAMKEIPDKLESCINEKYHADAHIFLPSQNGSKGKEDTGPERRKIGSKGQSSCSDQPYQAMLESYVLQLVCVHKVLKEASEQDTVEKV